MGKLKRAKRVVVIRSWEDFHREVLLALERLSEARTLRERPVSRGAGDSVPACPQELEGWGCDGSCLSLGVQGAEPPPLT